MGIAKMKKALKNSRRLFIVDIENATGESHLTYGSVRREHEKLNQIYGINSYDQVILAVSHSGNYLPATTWKTARILFKPGESGADLRLKKVMRTENIAERFSTVVLVSGDGVFAEEVALLRSQGVRVVVDSALRSLSRKLTKVASVISLMRSSNDLDAA